MMQSILFYFLAAMVVVPALLVVVRKNVFHCALWLIVSLTGVAGLYALLAADFLFAVQILVYVGGIMVLLLFVVLLAGRPSDWTGRQWNEKAIGAALFSAVLAAGIYTVIAAWHLSPVVAAPRASTGPLGQLLFSDMLLPTEFVSLILVAALIGAIYFSVRRSGR